jgi:hypothetical protein
MQRVVELVDNVYVQDGDVQLGNNWTVGGNLMWIATHYEKGSTNNGIAWRARPALSRRRT